MNSETFLEAHRETWVRLSLILDKMTQKGPSGLSQEELKSLGPLFRRVTAHLAYARTNFPGHEMNDYLNNLVVKAHGHIYKHETLGIRPVLEFFSREFPRLVKEQWRFISAAGLVLILGLTTGYFLHFFQPSLDGLIIPDSLKRMISEELGRGQLGADWSPGERPVISTAIMINNIQVGLLSFALGFTWGLATVLILFYNGLIVGVLGAVFTSHGYALDFWSLILPHGILEFAAIFTCGGAGLVLAKALVNPGDYKRRDALVVQGKIAVKLVLGTIPMFAAAALIEGFITPSLLPNYFKLIVAAFSTAAFFLYILTGNRPWGAKKAGCLDRR
ncbi:MAG: stage II sporulation protein M [Peptococcaceae bacterium]|nr:stage II sporulation protein M [Peptococcaceae bacterium]